MRSLRKIDPTFVKRLCIRRKLDKKILTVRVNGRQGVSVEILPCVKKETVACHNDVYFLKKK